MRLGLEKNRLLIITKARREGGLMADSGSKSLYSVNRAQVDDSADNCNVVGHKVRVCLNIQSVVCGENGSGNTYHVRHLDRYGAHALRDFIRP